MSPLPRVRAAALRPLLPLLVVVSLGFVPGASARPAGVSPSALARYEVSVGRGGESCAGIAVDPDGNAYVVGTTGLSRFPTTKGAFARRHAGGSDVFVTELAPDGRVLFATLLGGRFADTARGIALGADGSVYVCGDTGSDDFPTTNGAYDRMYAADGDSFVAKLSADGSTLLYSTYLGGASHEVGTGVRVDAQGRATFAGSTASSDFPTTPGAFDAAFGSDEDGFVTELSADGGSLVYSTFLGGDGFDEILGFTLDDAGSAVVTGFTDYVGFPATNAGHQSTPGSEDVDTFVTKLAPDGASLAYSTLLGGGRDEYGYGVALDGEGSVYLTGWTHSEDFPITAGAFQTTFNSTRNSDVFVTKLAPDGESIVYSTFVGSESQDFASAIAVDSEGRAYVGGASGWTDFPTTADALDATPTNGDDAFACELSADGASLLYSTVRGEADAGETAAGIGVDTSGTIYLAWHDFDVRVVVDAIPPLSVASCAPESGARNATKSVSLTGSRFAPGSTVDFGPGISVVSTTVVTSQRIDVQITIDETADRGPRDGVVTTPAGDTTTAIGCFRVRGRA